MEERNSLKNSTLHTVIIHIAFIVFCTFCIIPIISVVSVSITSEAAIAENGYSLIPSVVDFNAYRYILRDFSKILGAYGISITVTVVGTVISLFFTSMFAYAISKKDFKHRNKLALYVFITMIFSGGLVPTYMVIARVLGLTDTILALIIPLLINPFNIIIMKTYFQSLPSALFDSAKIDGCSEFRTLFSIVYPLSKPSLATIGLFIVLAYWNDWFLAFMYLSPEADNLIPLQYMLYRIMSNIQFLTNNFVSGNVTVDRSTIPNESARMAMCVIAAGPMLFVFPFFQKYFVRGLTVGAVKG